MVSFRQILQSEKNVTVCVTVFCRIRQQIVQNFVNLVAIEIGVHHIFLAHNREMKLFLAYQRFEALGFLTHKLSQIALRNPKFQIARLRLAELQNLLQQPYQPVNIYVHRASQFASLRNALLQVVERCRDYRERSHQLMRDVREELKFDVVQFLNLMLLHLVYPYAVAQSHAVAHILQHKVEDGKRRSDIQHERPPSEPPRRSDNHGNGLNLAPLAVFVRSLNLEDICSRCKVRISCFAMV